jgi:hypothetical protein
MRGYDNWCGHCRAKNDVMGVYMWVLVVEIITY